mmetsp:Transcript_10817/g.29425  ORF Transcript_10817/g.29425 Transcript_10817/m.29425 type:complete len:261 (+) Transcript_10817:943-1725(+)
MQMTTALLPPTCGCRRTPTGRMPRRPGGRRPPGRRAAGSARHLRPRTPWRSWRSSGPSRMQSLASRRSQRWWLSQVTAWPRRWIRRTHRCCPVGSSTGRRSIPASTTGTRLPSRPLGIGLASLAASASTRRTRSGRVRAPRRGLQSLRRPSRRWPPGPARRSRPSRPPRPQTRRRPGSPRAASSSPPRRSGRRRPPGCSRGVAGSRRPTARARPLRVRGPCPSRRSPSAQSSPRSRRALPARAAHGLPARRPSGPGRSER